MNARSLVAVAWLLTSFAVHTSAQVPGGVKGWGETNNGSGKLILPPGLTDIIAVAAGGEHSLALRSNGTVVAWGANESGQTTIPSGLANVKAIAAGTAFSMALRTDGTVAVWGANDANQTNVPAGLANVQAIAAGDSFCLALLSNGRIVAWGAAPGRTVPANLTNGVFPATAIAAGGSHGLAIRSGGTVVAWGLNTSLQTNVPAGLTASAIAAGSAHSIAVRSSDGMIVGWGQNTYGQATNKSIGAVLSIFAGATHSGAVRANGTVLCWGDNSVGQTNVTAGLTNVISAASHANHTLATYLLPPSIVTQPANQTVSSGGNVAFTVVAEGSPTLLYQWRRSGTNLPGAVTPTYSFADAQISHSGSYSVVVNNSLGAVTSSVVTLTVTAVPSISEHPVGRTVGQGTPVIFSVTAAGTAPLRYYWKKDGQLLSSTTNASYTNMSVQPWDAGTYWVVVSNYLSTVQSSNAVLTVVPPPGFAGQPQSQSVLRSCSVTMRATVTNATSLQWLKNGTNIPGATASYYGIDRATPDDEGAYAIVAANAFATNTSQQAVLTVDAPSSSDTDIAFWGQDAVVVDFDFIDMTPPPGLFGAIAVAAGKSHNLALLQGGSVTGWGDNQFGQGGLPPNLVATAIACGADHTLAITNGRVGAWGLNTSGQASPPPLTNVIAIAAGGNFSVAALSNGTVAVWGDNSANQWVVPSAVTNVARVAAGMEHCLALRRNGTVIGWAGNAYGQARAPFAVTNVNASVAAIAAGAWHSLALKSNGTVIAWGRNSFGQTNVPVEATNVIAIAAGEDHSMALRSDGVVVCWGNQNYGQTEPPPGLIASAIGAGGARSLAVRRTVLQLFAPTRVAPGQVRYSIRNSDGTAGQSAPRHEH